MGKDCMQIFKCSFTCARIDIRPPERQALNRSLGGGRGAVSL
ncbi:rCG24096 [Rattus norvegicus]|uniref:RCG24096 n=1 Tax=Rattus norvegicus TaxID=10116 RepID=A6KAX3_RAT|nr:rCG24096 [Rattus norvegicus]